MAPDRNSPAVPDVIAVPGGVAFIDIYRDQDPLTFWAKAFAKAALNPYAVNHVKRDIVIQSEDRSRELYREGPYDVRSVVRPLNRILRQIEASGLESFLEHRRVDSSEMRDGTVRISPPLGLWQEMNPYLERLRFWRRFIR